MHELHLAQDVLEKIKAAAQSQGLGKVSSAKVLIGESRITDPPEFKEILADIARGTVAEGFKLELEILPLTARCASCKKEFTSASPRLDCPACHSKEIEITSGKELVIADLK